MENRILVIDTETGGFDAKNNSLLSIGICVLEDRKIIAEEEYFIQSKIYHVTAGALAVNNINLVKLHETGLPKNEVIERIKLFVLKYFGANKPILLGHNVSFDIKFLIPFLDKASLLFSTKTIDTMHMCKEALAKGIVKMNINALDRAIKYFDIKTDSRHTALSDAKATAELYLRLIDLGIRG